MKATLILFLCVFLMISCGCATIAGRVVSGAENNNPKIKGDYSGIYPGLRIGYDFFFRPSEISVDDDFVNLSPAVKAPIMLVGIIDLPISLAFDTVLFPFDAIAWLASDSSPPEPESPEKESHEEEQGHEE